MRYVLKSKAGKLYVASNRTLPTEAFDKLRSSNTMFDGAEKRVLFSKDGKPYLIVKTDDRVVQAYVPKRVFLNWELIKTAAVFMIFEQPDYMPRVKETCAMRLMAGKGGGVAAKFITDPFQAQLLLKYAPLDDVAKNVLTATMAAEQK